MPFFLAICGHKNSGKTLLGSFIVENLTKKGLKVGVIKSFHHEEIVTDFPSKDTWLYREKGAFLTSLFQTSLFTCYFGKSFFSSYQERDLFTFWESIFWDCDLVLLEGFKNLDSVLKLWCLKEGESPEEIKKNLKNLLGFVVISNSEHWKKLFPQENILSLERGKEILNLVEKFLSKEPEVLLKVNEYKIPLNPFVQSVLKSTLEGFLKALKKVPEKIEKLEIKIKF